MIDVRARVLHNSVEIADLTLEYAGRPNVYQGSFDLGRVAKNYEVLDVEVTAAQDNSGNYGAARRTFKLTP